MVDHEKRNSTVSSLELLCNSRCYFLALLITVTNVYVGKKFAFQTQEFLVFLRFDSLKELD